MSCNFTKLIHFLSLFFCIGLSATAQKSKGHNDPQMTELLKNYEKKIYFTQNKGQWPSNILYKADFPMGQAQATKEGMIVGTFDPQSLNAFHDQANRREEAFEAHIPFNEKQAELKGHGWLMKFLNSSSNMNITNKTQHADKMNFFIGDDASKHATDVLSYNEVWYNEVYKNTDVRYYPSAHGTLEYDIICKPGSNPKDIELMFDGIDKKYINEKGELVLETSVGDMTIATPVAYQKINGKEVTVEVKYEINQKGALTFKLGKYNSNETLIIDPIALVWATWVSNNASTNSHGHGIHVDPATGDIYVLGWYNSTGLITVNAFQNTVANGQDIIMGRYHEPSTVGGAGTRIWQTYLGGTGSDNPYAIDQGADGIYITGIIPATGAIPYPMIGGTAYGATPSTVDNRAQTGQNVFITKINLAGNSIKSCVVGGNGTEGVYDIRVTSLSGQVVVCGLTASTNLATLWPSAGATNTLNGTNDALVFKVSQDLNSVIWIRNFGGAGTEQGNIMLAEPTSGDIFVAGTTTSANFPTASPRQNARVGTSDGFIMKMNGNGVTKWSSYYNSSGSATATSILCMEFNTLKNKLVFGGLTTGLAASNVSAGVIQTAYGGGTNDFFVGSIDTNQTFNWGTYFGGSGNEVNMMGLNLDLNNDVYIFGYTNGTFATTAGAFESTKPGGNDKVFSKISANGTSLLYSTYYGTSGNETDPVGERGIKFSDCRIYTIVTSDNNALPLTAGAITTNKISANGILEMGIVEWGSPPPLSNNSVTGTQVVCAGSTPTQINGTAPTYTLPNITRNGVISAHPSLGGISGYQWQLSTDGGTTWSNIAGATGVNLPGNLIGPLTNNMRIRRIINGDLCVVSTDNTIVSLETFGANLTVTPSCQNLNNGIVTSSVNGGTAPYTYSWSNGATTQNVSNLTPGVYTVTVKDASGCTASTTVTVPEYPDVNITGSPNFCSGGSTVLTATPAVAGATYLWNTGATTQSINVTTSGTYSVVVTFQQGCTQSASTVASQIATPTIAVAEVSGITNNDGTLCAGESAVLTANPGPIYSWSTGEITQSITVSTAGTYTVTVSGGGGCNGTASVTINVNPRPTPAISGPSGICIAQSATLTATGGNTYVWAPGGQTTAAITTNSPGTYSVTATNAYGCEALTSFVLARNTCLPTATNDAATTLEDTPVNISVLTNDNFGGDGPSTGAITVTVQPANGVATVNTNGTPNNPTDDYITYTPNLNFNGVNTFTYRICDASGDCATAVVTVTVTAVNDPPVAVNDNATTNEDTPVTIPVLANDSDVDGNLVPSTVAIGTGPLHGTVSINNVTGAITYTPAANYNGPDSFTYRVCDDGTPLPSLCSNYATVTINVIAVNDPPVAVNDNATTNEDTPVAINVLINDSDIDGNLVPSTVAIGTGPAHGTVSINAVTGVITYTPAANYNGPDSFTYRVCDDGTPLPSMCSNLATVTINVIAVNDPPVAVNDNATTNEDTPVTIPVLTNDSDVDGNLVPSTVAIGTGPLHGTVSINNVTGAITYTPAANYNGPDSFTYRVCDDGTPLPSLCSNYATVTINVTAVNDPPVAVNDNATTNEDTPVAIPVLANDSDIDGNLIPSTVAIGTGPAHGTVSINAVTGVITYTPAANYNGPDSFTYRVCDDGTPLPSLCSNLATVTINVLPVNDAPVAVNDNATTNEDTPVNIPILANDSDIDGNLVPGSITIVTPPAHGTLSFSPTGVATYTPAANYNGTDSFVYYVCDDGTPLPSMCSNNATVTINILPVNDAPVAVNDNATTNEDTPVAIPVLANDSDIDGNLVPSTVAIGTGPANGTVSINNVTGVITYTPNANFSGTDSFTYRVCDDGTPLPSLCSNFATVTINVLPVNDPPVAVNDNATTNEDTPVAIPVLANDYDVDGNLVPASVTVTSGPSNGTVSINPLTGVITYTPNLNYNGSDSFTYQVCDDGTPLPSLCSSATVTLTVTPVNDAPVAVNDNATTNEDTPVAIPVLGNDSDVDGNLVPSTVAIGTGPANGTVSINNVTGVITYTPNANFSGTDSFTYRVCDDGTPLPSLCSNLATVTINVLPVNDPPVAIKDDYTTLEDTPISGNVSLNDSDVDGPAAIYTLVSGPSNGSLVLNANGTFTYTPNLNYNGVDNFIYQLCDNGVPNLCDTALVTLTIIPVNDPPVAVDDYVTTPEDVPVPIFVLGNDYDVDGVLQPNSVAIVSPPSHGTVSINSGTGVITYTPSLDYNGTDSFSYIVCDNGTPLPALCDTAVVYLTVTPVNDPVIVTVTPISTNEDTPTGTICFPINDDPGDNHIVTVCGVTNGSVVATVNNVTDQVCVVYTPNPNYYGPDDICIVVCDDGVPTECDTVHIPVTVFPINDPPVANPDNATTNEDTPVVVNVLANDSDIDGQLVPSTVAIATPPTNGTVTINGVTGAITYIPNPNFNGTDSFIYQVCDNGTPLPSQCDTAIVFITVQPVNDPPVVVNDNATTNEDTPVSIPVLANDSDVDGNLVPGTVTVTSGPSNGTVSVDPTTGIVTYTPNSNFNGTDTFTYQVCDDGTPLPAQCASGTVTITVTPVNDPPVANPDYATTNEDTPVAIPVLANDSDVDGQLVPNTVVIATPPANGTVSVNNATGVITYTPNLNFNGTDSFIYQVCDNGTPLPSQCDTAIVFITVQPVNDPPVVVNDNATTNEDTPVSIPVLANDSDVDGNLVPGTVTVTSGPSNGTVSVDPTTGIVTYTPNSNFNGTDTFTYQVCDDGTPLPAQCASGTVTITVTPVNDPPVANPDYATTNEDTPVIINVLANDTDVDGQLVPSSVVVGTLPAHGTVSINGVTGAITYTPNPNFNGTDTFIYQVCDNGTPLPSQCDTAIVFITVLPVNDPPVAVNDNVTTNEDTPIAIPVLSNDSDVDGNLVPGTVTVTSGPAHGTVSINPTTGVITYTPALDYNGPDTFTYQVCDDGTPLPSLCASATVTITVTPVNDPPVVNADYATTNEDTPVVINVLANDTDVDGQLVPNSVASVTLPAHGTISINALTGAITYTPNLNYNGTDSFIYIACDNGTPLPSKCDTAVVHITINPVNDAPIANNDTYTTNEDTPINGNVSLNDSDVDGPTATYTVLTGPTHGTLVLDPNSGIFTYTPNSNYNGPDIFTYQLCDGGTPNLCDTATVTINVLPVNDPPSVNGDNVTTPEDTPIAINVLANDFDVETAMNPASVTVLVQPLHGTVSVNGITGVITYTPNVNYNGTDSFIYQACDQGLPLPALCDTALVRITITPVNDPPVAGDDFFSTPEDTPLSGTVTANDYDPDGPGATYTLLTGTAHGSIVFNANGSFTYTPSLNYNGTDVFTYQLCDGGTPNLCDTATVTITIVPVNDPPVINFPNVTTPEDTPITICSPITDPDVGDVFTAGFCSTPAHGTVTGPAIFNGQVCFTYTPTANYNGLDSVCVILCDQHGACDTSTSVITVTAVNDPPVAVNDNATTNEDTPISIPVLTNDYDVDGNLVPGSVTVTSSPAHGTVTVNPVTGVITYTPNQDYNGTDTFIYRVCDDGTPLPSLCSSATVTITILPVNDPPIVNADYATTNEDTPVIINVLANDTDVDGQLVPNSVAPVTLPAHGTVTVNPATGAVTYTPNPNYNGTDSFIYIACDNGTPLPSLCDTAVVYITVNAVNDPPVANNDNVTTPEDTPIVINVTANDTDVDGNLDVTSVSIVSGPAHGTVTVNPATGAITYTPSQNYNGTDSFTYSVCDTGTPVYCDTAVVNITIIPVNDPPVINFPNVTTPEDTPITICSPITDPDVGNTFTATLCGGPYNGTVSTPTIFNGQVCITYTPGLDYNGTDSICVIVCDQNGACDTGTTVITVTPVNDPPIAVNDNYTTPEDTPLTANVSTNDNLTDGPGAIFTVVTPTSHGTVVLDPNTGVFTYTPNLNYNGPDVFTYQLCDGGTPNLCSTATVTINITPVNDPPVINFPPTTTPEETPVTICSPITDPDAGDTFTVGLCGGPLHGTITGPTVFNGQVCFTYTPSLNYNGLDSVCVIVCDQNGACDTSTAVINVTPVNDPPIATDDVATTTTNTPVVIPVINNDTDVDGGIDPTSVTIITPPANGNVTVNPVTGEVTYTPNPNACGTDSFVYQVCDLGTPLPALCDQATVTITIQDTQAPVITCPANAVVSNTANQCGYTMNGTGFNATATDNCAGPVTLTHNYFAWPNPNSLQGATFPVGTTTVVWTATDAAGNTSTCTFTVTVNDTQKPTFVNCNSGATITLGVFGNCQGGVIWPVPTATDNCSGLTVTQTQGPALGSVLPVGTYPIQYVATDAAGNTDTCSFTVVLVNTLSPTIVCPANTITVNANPGSCTWTAPPNSLSPLLVQSNCNTTVTWSVLNPDGSTNTGTNNVSGYVFAVGTSTVTYTVTETTSGQTSSCTFTVTVIDSQAPTFTNCPVNVTVSNDPGVCGAAVTWTPPTATDNCGAVTVTSTHTPGFVFPIGTTTVTYTATDAGGLTATCSFNVTVNDTEAPVIVGGCPSNITLTNDAGVCGAVATWTVPTVSDNCGGATIASNHNSGEVFPIGTTTVTYTAKDAAGNVTTCSFTVTVTDTQAPTFVNCPGNITVSNFVNTCYQQVYWPTVTATDNCGSNGLVITSTYSPGYVFPVGVTPVTYTVTDLAGNSTTCSFTVTVNDTQFPTIQGCPPSVTVNNTPNTCGAVVTWAEPSVFDNCPGVTVTRTHTSGTTFPIGTTTVTYTVTDAVGNTATCSFTVTVNDTQFPVIANCPSNISVPSSAGICGAAVTWTAPTVSDNCPGVTFVSTHAPGDVFPIGVTTVTYTATDASGHVTTCSFTVTVTDTQAPVFAGCPTNITTSATAGLCGAVVNWTPPTATDNCPGTVTVTSNYAPGATFPVGTTTVTYTAVDAVGNTSTCTFTVTVTDNLAPVITNCPTNITVNNAFNTCGAPVFWTPPTITDNCGSGLVVTASHTPGTVFPIGTTTVTYTATDGAGNVSTCSFTITVNDTQAPVIIGCPGNISINSGVACSATATWTAPSAIDNCPGTTLTTTHAPGSSFNLGTTTVTYTATDASGNTSTCSFTVTVTDAAAPVITNCPSNVITVAQPGICGAVVSWTPPTVTDNCGAVTVTSTHAPGDTFNVGSTTVTYTATDAAGNVSTCTFIVTVNDTQLPVINNCPSNITINAGAACSAVATWTLPSATDNCGIASLTTNHNSGESFPIGTTTVTYTATDVNGNVSTCTFTVTITDSQAPVVTNCPANISLPDQFNTCGRSVTWTPPTFTDNCGGMTVVSSHVPGTFFPAGTTTVTYTATDASGNVTTCSFTITIVDQQFPQIASCPIDVTLNSNPGICGAVYNWVLPTAFDNCPGVTLTTTHAPGSVFPVGVTTVVYTATDVSNNVTICTFHVTVLDVEAPAITGCPANIIISNTTGSCDGVATWTPPTASDNCSVTSFTSTHNSGDVFPVGTTAVVYTATDAAGNTTTCTFNVTVNDTELPVIAGCPSDITLSNTVGTCGATATWTAPTATDNCNTGFTFTSTHNSGDVFPVGTTAVIYTATDAAGNISTCTFNVIVNDTELPVITGCPANIASCTDTITWTPPTATDNCTLVSFTSNYNSGTIFPVGTTTVTYTATDAAGNVSTCSFTVTVSKPKLTLTHTDVTCYGASNGTATATVINAVGPLTYNWGAQGNTATVTNLAPGTYVVTVSDGIGCSVTDSVKITQPEELSVVATSIGTSTCGLQDGSIQVVTVGGTKPYSYSWTGGYTTQNLANVYEGTYHLTVTDANGCTDTLTATIKCEFGLIPQLVTPNGDGHNDTWVIPGIDHYPNAVVELYNRWGNLVFKASPYNNDWNGVSKGVLNAGKGELPAGTYFYVIRLNPSDKYAMTGYIELTY